MSRTTRNRTTVLWVGLSAAILFALVAVVSRPAVGDGTAASTTAAVPAERLGSLPAAVNEGSGVVVSRLHPDVLWTHNDGADGRLFAVGLHGEPRGELAVTGVDAVDWEDLATGPCPEDPDSSCLYIADTGDNQSARSDAALIIVPEPDTLPAAGEVRPVAVLHFRYSDGPADVEGLALGPDGDAILVSKGGDGSSRLYRLELRAPDLRSGGGGAAADTGRTPAIARLEAILPIDVATPARRVTGASLSPDGETLAVRTPTAVHLFVFEDWTQAPRSCFVGGREPQGEAIDFLPDGGLLLTGEAGHGGPAPILRVSCQEGVPDGGRAGPR